MNEAYLNLAEGFEKVAAGLRGLATITATPDAIQTLKASVKEETKGEKKVDIEDIRAVLANKSRDGKTKDVKALLLKYDAGKLSSVKEEDYARLLVDAEAL